ncbi:glycosyl hydrolase [Cellulomonas edaphi]|uniref:glucan endo-1,3-beta-D-glucosidase n=1 Tax=Cellulomonas edaphi TaxID=3053468 RepID=A0ABT7S483_9CELL|nr:glycosyl hydrolase [Cellulomons edaphi]MDM7829822.1 glycosyl hydrolase [Cellulomons edaphi]
MTARRWLVAGSVAAVIGVTGALVAVASPWSGPGETSGPTGAPSVALAAPPTVDRAALVASVPHRSVAKVEPVRLAEGLVPPTNRWYSGLVFGDEPQPVFAEPLSFGLTADGFTLGLPAPTVSAQTIAGPHVPALTVSVGAASARISAADPVSATIELLDASGKVLGRVVIAEGSPFVSFTAARDVSVRTQGPLAATPEGPATAAGERWALVGPAYRDGVTAVADGESVSWYALPDAPTAAAAETLARAAAHPVTGVDVGYAVDADAATTRLTYRTADRAETAHVLMPHHTAGAGCDLGTYPSTYGDLRLCAGSTLVSSVPVQHPAGAFDLGDLDADRRSTLVAAVKHDVASTPAFPSDTYFGGKALLRAATLISLGDDLGVDISALRATTVAALREWGQPDGCELRDARCVVYDEKARSAIGLTASFGSDELNDHHFHYGYLLAAAGMLAADDKALAKDLADVMNLLAQDIAAAVPSDQLPQLRSFDPYAGHSWASGTSPFADGNNQESSSEAVNAWNGLGLWAAASGQKALGTQATWLLSTEAATARAYWTAPALPAGFAHQVVALNWGGKRDWATWFSPEPSAMLGIQLLPLGPAQLSLSRGVDAERIRASVREAAPNGYDVMFGGDLLGYLALAGPDDASSAWTELESLPASAIDDGTSRAALLAFVAAAGSSSPPSG